MTDHLIIRKATENDIIGIQALAHATNQPPRTIEQLYSDESLQLAVNSTARTLLVADDNGVIVGLCGFGTPLLEDCEDIRQIHRLLVHPDYTLDEVGNLFLDTVIETIDEEMCVQQVAVYVRYKDRARVKFYLSNEFHHEATEDMGDEWYLVLDLVV